MIVNPSLCVLCLYTKLVVISMALSKTNNNIRLLTDENIESLRIRGYISHQTYLSNNGFDILNKLSKYNINPTPYLSLFNGLNQTGVQNINRFICLNWKNIAESLQDESIDFQNKDTIQIYKFFIDTEKQHRILFFIEIVYKYFFPAQ